MNEQKELAGLYERLEAKHEALQVSHKDLTDTLELLLTDIEWSESSPTLKLINRMIKQAKKLNQ